MKKIKERKERKVGRREGVRRKRKEEGEEKGKEEGEERGKEEGKERGRRREKGRDDMGLWGSHKQGVDGESCEPWKIRIDCCPQKLGREKEEFPWSCQEKWSSAD